MQCSNRLVLRAGPVGPVRWSASHRSKNVQVSLDQAHLSQRLSICSTKWNGSIRTSVTAAGKSRPTHTATSYRAYSTTHPNIADVRHHEATIFALSTAPGRAAIAIVRCSGPAVLDIYGALCPSRPPPSPRHATLRKLYSPSCPSPSPTTSPLSNSTLSPPATAAATTPPSSTGATSLLDPGALILYFPAPQTVTGEPVLELHLHGGTATVRAVLSAISSLSTAQRPIRYAEPGEFTRRAFYNGRMDLPQIEALGDTLSAETEAQRRLAIVGAEGRSGKTGSSGQGSPASYGSIGGVLSQRYESWRGELLQARGELEALIDFSEDQHFDESPRVLAAGVAAKVKVLLRKIEASIGNAARGELLRNGIKVALLGAPNVGKSSLLNRIVGREAAIVNATAGTTRDVIETNVDIGGFFCNFGDLAGLRGGRVVTSTSDGQLTGRIDEVEEEGIRRAKARALAADVVIVVCSVERDPDGRLTLTMPPEVEETVKQCDLGRQRIVMVVNKVDRLGKLSNGPKQALLDRFSRSSTLGRSSFPFLISCAPETQGSGKDDGIQGLLEGLTAAFRELTEAAPIPGLEGALRGGASGYEESLGASERQARLLEACRDQLSVFLDAVDLPGDPEVENEQEVEIDIVLAAESLRAAAECLAKMTGRGEGGDVEDVLGVVFEKFCVGK